MSERLTDDLRSYRCPHQSCYDLRCQAADKITGLRVERDKAIDGAADLATEIEGVIRQRDALRRLVYGGLCPTCEGWLCKTCRDCNGTGRTPGLAEQLEALHAVNQIDDAVDAIIAKLREMTS